MPHMGVVSNDAAHTEKTTMTKKDQKAAEVLANRKLAFAKKLGALTGHVAARIPAREIATAFDAGRTAEDFAAEIAAREPVGLALHPLKAEAVKAAAADAAVTVGHVQRKLEAAGWDIKVAAPRAKSCWDRDYKTQNAYRALVSSLTESVKEGYHYPRPGEPEIVRMSEKGIIRFIAQAEENAALFYDAFIVKMVAKVGEVTAATINGNHVWDHSILRVTLPTGEVQKWKTQQIWNYSVHGLRFPQWPSRVVK